MVYELLATCKVEFHGTIKCQEAFFEKKDAEAYAEKLKGWGYKIIGIVEHPRNKKGFWNDCRHFIKAR